MKKRAFLWLILGTLVFQVVLLDAFRLFWVKPDILLVLAVSAGLFPDLKWALLFSGLAGICKDIIAIQPLAFTTILFTLWGYLVFKLSRKIAIESDTRRVALVFFITLANAVANYSLSVFLESSEVSLAIFLRVAFLETVYTTAISWPIFKIIKPAID